MVDYSLQELMRGNLGKTQKKPKDPPSPISHALAQQIDELVDQILANDDPSSHPFVTPAVYRAQLKQQLTSDLEFPELSAHLTSAFTILAKDQKCLDAATNRELHSTWAQAADKLKHMDPDRLLLADNYQDLLEIPDSCLDSLNTIALCKFDEGLYGEAVDIYVLLTTLSPGVWAYWLRLAMCAQESGNLSLASRSYEATSAINGDLIEPYLFATECHALNAEKELAAISLSAGEQVAQHASSEALELLAQLKESLNTQ